MTNETLAEQLMWARDKFNIAVVNWRLAKSEFDKAEEIYEKSFEEIYRIQSLIEEQNK